MELMYPIAIVICLIISIVLIFFKPIRKTSYTNGKKIANTKYIKETEYYQKKVKEYKILSNTLKILSAVIIITTGILISRPVSIQEKSDEKYNRDIFISLDISTSECEVNLELINKFIEIMPSIEGDRIGIVIFNTAPVVYCPLTDDYDYVLECFNTLIEQLNIAIENNGYPPYSYIVDGEEVPTLWYGGVGLNSSERGSSLVGDGLAGTIYSFPDLKENSDRTRIIVFATDNDVAGTETVSLEEACSLCNQYGIYLYAYCPSVEMNIYASEENISNYRVAVEQYAGGKFYTGDLDKNTSDIFDEIKETKTSLLQTSKKTYITDYPEAFVVIILIIFLAIIFIEKRIKL